MLGLSPRSTLSGEKRSSSCVLVVFFFFKAIVLQSFIRPIFCSYDWVDNIMS